MHGELSTYQRLLTQRKRSKARAVLVKQYAIEKGLSMPQAFRRIYQMRERLDENGDLIRRPRSRRYTAELLQMVKAALADRERTFRSIAIDLGVNREFVRRVANGHFS